MLNKLTLGQAGDIESQFADPSSMVSPHVVVVILNNNRNDDTLECLASLARSTYPNQSVFVLDIVSAGKAPLPRDEQTPGVRIVPLTENRGYTGNNNVGFRLALECNAEFVFLLNNDAIIAPDCIEQLVAACVKDPAIGMTGPIIYHYDEVNTIQTAGGVLDKFWTIQHLGRNEVDAGQFSIAHPVDWLTGCALMIRRTVVEQLGGFDERLFMYWEEIDWCLRARQHGWSLLPVPQAKIWHKGAQRHYAPPPRVTYYSTRNQFLVLRKHRAPLWVYLYKWVETFRTLTSWTVRPKWRHMRLHRDAMWQAVCDLILGRWGMRTS